MSKLKVANAYYRASTNERLQANSLEVQRAIVRAFADRNGYELKNEFVEYASGSNDDRPAFNEALQNSIAKNEVLICWKVDRLSRSLSIFNKINDHLHLLRFAELGDTEPNLMVLSVLLGCAQQELENTRIRVRETYRLLKEQDPSRKFGNPNIVKDAQPKGLKIRMDNAREFNTRIQGIVADLRMAGYNLTQCVAQLNDELKITTRRGCLWSAPALCRVLKYQASTP
tara:strand:+ start:2940 stop:3623 length:684 start_codon:yes stop_codon:yes gene_type:complete